MWDNWHRSFYFLVLLWPWVAWTTLSSFRWASKCGVQKYFYHQPSLNPIHLQTSECTPMFKIFYTVRKTAVISLLSCNPSILTQRSSQDVQPKLLHHHMKFHPDHMKRVQENIAKRLCFALTLWPPSKVNVWIQKWKWYKWQESMVPVSIASKKKFGLTVCL